MLLSLPASAIGVSHRNVYHYTIGEEIMLQCAAVGDGFRCLVEGPDVPQGYDCFYSSRVVTEVHSLTVESF